MPCPARNRLPARRWASKDCPACPAHRDESEITGQTQGFWSCGALATDRVSKSPLRVSSRAVAAQCRNLCAGLKQLTTQNATCRGNMMTGGRSVFSRDPASDQRDRERAPERECLGRHQQ